MKKRVSFGISASIRIGQGSQSHLYAGLFTGLLETRFESNQGKYVKLLLIEHKKKMPFNNFLCFLIVLTFWKRTQGQRKQVISEFVLAF